MATVCAGSIALASLAIPHQPVAGLALGLIQGRDGAQQILSDISSEEDQLSDLDLKIAGTAQGVTAFQMDIQGRPLSLEQLAALLERGRLGRLEILKRMAPILETLPTKEDPQVHELIVDSTQIQRLRGPKLQQLQKRTRTQIHIDSEGRALIFALNAGALQRAEEGLQARSLNLELGVLVLARVDSLRRGGVRVRFADYEVFVADEDLIEAEAVRPGQTLLLMVMQPTQPISLSERAAQGMSREDALNS